MIKLKNLIALAIVSALFVTTGCKKNDSPDPVGKYYFKFKANGVSKDFRDGTLSNFNGTHHDNEYITSLGGSSSDTDPNINVFVIGLTTEGLNKTNTTYTNYHTTAPGFEKAILLLLTYTDDNGTNYSAAFDDELIEATYPDGVANNQLTITEATSTFIKGKFSGTLYATNFTKEMKITEGEFYLEED